MSYNNYNNPDNEDTLAAAIEDGRRRMEKPDGYYVDSRPTEMGKVGQHYRAVLVFDVNIKVVAEDIVSLAQDAWMAQDRFYKRYEYEEDKPSGPAPFEYIGADDLADPGTDVNVIFDRQTGEYHRVPDADLVEAIEKVLTGSYDAGFCPHSEDVRDLAEVLFTGGATADKVNMYMAGYLVQVAIFGRVKYQ